MLIIITVTLYDGKFHCSLTAPLAEFHHHTSSPSAQPPRKMQGSPRVCAGPGAVLGQRPRAEGPASRARWGPAQAQRPAQLRPSLQPRPLPPRPLVQQSGAAG